jgi:hypothetical protein
MDYNKSLKQHLRKSSQKQINIKHELGVLLPGCLSAGEGGRTAENIVAV